MDEDKYGGFFKFVSRPRVIVALLPLSSSLCSRNLASFCANKDNGTKQHQAHVHLRLLPSVSLLLVVLPFSNNPCRLRLVG